jgi:hypothetical protein
MNRMRSVALPALLALGGLSLWGSTAAAQYGGGGTAYAPGYYYAPGPGYYYAAPAPSFRSAVVVPGGWSGRRYPAPARSGRPVPSPNSGLEPESLPAQIAENIAPAPAAPRPGPAWRSGWWRGRTWRRTSRNW